MTYPPQQPPGLYPPVMPPYPGGYPTGPPPKKNTGLIIGIVAAVVVALAALGITGFVAPGFFLGDDGEQKAAPKTPSGDGLTPPGTDSRGGESLEVPGGSGQADIEEVKRVAGEGIRAINERDAELAKSVSCDPESAGDLSGLPPDAHAEVTGDPVQSGSEQFKVPVKFTAGGDSTQDFLNLANQNDRWCILD